MSEMNCTVTLWLAWYREQKDDDQERAGQEQLRRLLRLKMLYASSREEARVEMQRWLERKGLFAQALERLEPSPYGLQFQALKATAL
jgi:hypothetical protein